LVRRLTKEQDDWLSITACAGCGGFFVARDVQVDHIDPVVDPEDGFQDLDVFIDRLYCEAENLQVLCKECHKVKTNLSVKKGRRNEIGI
jgi:hypothetical protein